MARVGYTSWAGAGPLASMAADATVPTAKLRRSILLPSIFSAPGIRTCLPLNPTDRIDGVVGALAVDVPEFLEIRTVEVIEFLARVCERGLELVGMRGVFDGVAQNQHNRLRRSLRREDADPQIVFGVVAKLFERRDGGQFLRARRTEHGQWPQLAGLDMRKRRGNGLSRALRVVAKDRGNGRAAAVRRQVTHFHSAGGLVEQRKRQVSCAIEAARAEHQRIRVFFDVLNEFLGRLVRLLVVDQK